MDWLSIMAQISGTNDPVTYAIPVFILLMVIEIWIDLKEKLQLYEFKEAAACLAMGLGSLVINLFVKAFYFYVFWKIYEHTGFFKEQLSFTVMGWVLLLFADDFSFYWHHRLSHEVRLLWAAHSNHHSSQDYNFAVALRQSWTEGFYKFLFYAWLPVLGFHPLMVFSMVSISLIYQFFLHTQVVKKLPAWIEFIFNTPSHHRVHHGVNLQYLDKNHAGIFIIWDRLFGTFEPEGEAVVYGLTKNIDTKNPVKIAVAEFKALWEDVRRAPTWKDKLKYIFYPPGWSHDGSSLTVKEIMRRRQKSGDNHHPSTA
jgi:sterol desaturase/sphingolipid hydroxylase (fatty acid hydroxylase superfamily)